MSQSIYTIKQIPDSWRERGAINFFDQTVENYSAGGKIDRNKEISRMWDLFTN